MIPMLFLRPAFGAYGRKSKGEGEGKEKERKKKKERRKMCGERNGRWTYLGGGIRKYERRGRGREMEADVASWRTGEGFILF